MIVNGTHPIIQTGVYFSLRLSTTTSSNKLFELTLQTGKFGENGERHDHLNFHLTQNLRFRGLSSFSVRDLRNVRGQALMNTLRPFGLTIEDSCGKGVCYQEDQQQEGSGVPKKRKYSHPPSTNSPCCLPPTSPLQTYPPSSSLTPPIPLFLSSSTYTDNYQNRSSFIESIFPSPLSSDRHLHDAPEFDLTAEPPSYTFSSPSSSHPTNQALSHNSFNSLPASFSPCFLTSDEFFSEDFPNSLCDSSTYTQMIFSDENVPKQLTVPFQTHNQQETSLLYEDLQKRIQQLESEMKKKQTHFAKELAKHQQEEHEKEQDYKKKLEKQRQQENERLCQLRREMDAQRQKLMESIFIKQKQIDDLQRRIDHDQSQSTKFPLLRKKQDIVRTRSENLLSIKQMNPLTPRNLKGAKLIRVDSFGSGYQPNTMLLSST